MTGYRALDLADSKGALCAKLLADLGAEVIKIERLKKEEVLEVQVD